MSGVLKFIQPCSTLLIATTQDAASMNLYSSLLCKPYWNEINHQIYETKKGNGGKLYLWMQNEPLLQLNYPDQTFTNLIEKSENDIFDLIFLSKHFAASGKASLTVHPIGIPWQFENSRSGGIPGRCSPPNMRIAELYRQLLEQSKSLPSQVDIPAMEVTLEATHHEPYCDKPVCFVEIGSSENEWSNERYGTIWANTLEKHFALGMNDVCEDIIHPGIAIVTIGGGHYVPKMNDLARLGTGLYTGHALTNYALQAQFDTSHPDYVSGKWQEIVKEAISSTCITYTGMKVVCLIDKKAFGAGNRKAIEELLDEESIQWTYTSADIEAMWKLSGRIVR